MHSNLQTGFGVVNRQTTRERKIRVTIQDVTAIKLHPSTTINLNRANDNFTMLYIHKLKITIIEQTVYQAIPATH